MAYETHTSAGSFARIPLALIVLLCALTFTAYWTVAGNEFIREFDDGDYILDNPLVREGLSVKGVSRAFTSLEYGNWHPLTWLSHMLDVQLFGLQPAAHHLVSLVVHVITAALLFLVLRGMTGALWRSAGVAALFAVHPLHVESVAWAAERKDVLSGLFWVLTMGAYLRYVRKPGAGRYGVTLLLLALGLMAKPMLVTLPVVLLILDFWPLGRYPRPCRSVGRTPSGGLPSLLIEKLPFLALSAGSILATIAAQARHGSVISLGELPAAARLANVLISLVKYIEKLFWPRNLGVFYPIDYHPPLAGAAVAGLVLAAVTVFFVRHRRRSPFLAAGWAWYLITLLPVIGIVHVGDQGLADRYTYIPLIGLFVLVLWGIVDHLPQRSGATLTATAGVVMVIGALAILTRMQTGYWRNAETLWEHLITFSEDNLTAHTNLGLYLERQGRWEEAIVHYRESVRISPGDADAHYNLGGALLELGKTQEAENRLKAAFLLRPTDADTNYKLGLLHERQGRIADALASYERAVALNPDFPAALNGLGVVLSRMGRIAEAERAYRRAIAGRPRFALAHFNLGSLLLAQGRASDAAANLERAVALKPDFVEALVNLGLARERQGRFAEAEQRLREALRLRPGDVRARSHLMRVREKAGS